MVPFLVRGLAHVKPVLFLFQPFISKMPIVSHSSRRLFSSVLWSMAGTVLPMLAALVAVPWLMRYIGQERLGVLSLVWVVVGYFSFLDMGLGRAVTVAVAALRVGVGAAHPDEKHVLGSASTLLISLGGGATVLLAGCIGVWGVPFHLSSAALRDEVTTAVIWTLPSLPLLLLSSVLRGHLEGVGAFRQLNLVRIPTGVMLVAGPCISAFFSPSLIGACLCILLVRMLHVAALWYLVAQELGCGVVSFAVTLWRATSFAWLHRLLSFGGWVTVSNVVGPIIVYVDRFVISATLAASAVTVYAIPFDMMSRLPVLVAALCSVLLPELTRLSTLAAATAPGALRRAHQLAFRASGLSVAVVLGLVLLGYAVTPWALRVWLGSEFSAQATELTRILLLAFGINAVAQIPFTALQAVGRVRAVALLHLSELLPYAALVFFAISWLGIVGAAWAWLLRSTIDYLVLAWMWHADSGHNTTAIKA